MKNTPGKKYPTYRMESEMGVVRGKGAGKARSERVALGLTLLSMCCKAGVPLTNHDQAAWCEVSESAIQIIEAKAIHKLRKALECDRNPLLRELVDAILNR